MTALAVEACGPATSLQDAGRFGYQRFGVSPAGAMDAESLALANALVGNPPTMAGIELALLGGRFRAEGGGLRVALCGPGGSLAVAGRAVPAAAAASVGPGEPIEVGPARGGIYLYLTVGGGFALAPDMESLSVHRRSGIGGRPLAAGDRLPCSAPAGPLLRLASPLEPDRGPIRIMLGPQEDHFTPAALRRLVESEFRIGFQADRMGCRLDGPALEHAQGYNIVSDGIVAGHIQVPGDGRPIVLLRDRQTTGGYPKIATVITADIGRFAQLPPGSPVRFRAVAREEAVAALREMRSRIASLPGRLVAAAPALSTETLLSANLISGVSSARE